MENSNHINNALRPPVISSSDRLSALPDGPQNIITVFLQAIDSTRFREVSRTWEQFYQEKSNEHSIRVCDLLRCVPRQIFRRQGFHFLSSRILHASQRALVILEQEGVFCTSNRKTWRNISPDGSPDPDFHFPVQTISQMGVITFAQSSCIYTVRLEDNTLIHRGLLPIRPPQRLQRPCLNIIQSRNNEWFYVYRDDVAYLGRLGDLIPIDVACGGDQYRIKKSILQGKWLSLIICEMNQIFTIHDTNTKLHIYDTQTKQLVFEARGQFCHTKNRLIVNNSENIFVFDMDSLSPEWQQNPVWVGTIENGKTVITACNDRYLVLQTAYCPNQGEVMEKALTGSPVNFSELRIFTKYTMVDLIDGSQESYTKRVSHGSSQSSFLVENFLFLYLDGRLDVIDRRLKKLIAADLEIPGFDIILDAKILDNELLIYFSTKDHLHCMVQFTLKEGNIPLANEADVKEMAEAVPNTPVVHEAPIGLPRDPIAQAPDDPMVAAEDVPGAPPHHPHVAPVENHAPNLLSSLWSMFSSCFSFIANFFIRFFRE